MSSMDNRIDALGLGSKMLDSLEEAMKPLAEREAEYRQLFERCTQSIPRIAISSIVPDSLAVYESIKAPMAELGKQIAEMTGSMMDYPGLKETAEQLGRLAIYAVTDEPIVKSLSSWSEAGREIVKSLPDFSEILEEGESGFCFNVETVRRWAKFGWTLAPEATIVNYYAEPETKQEADEFICTIHNDDANERIMRELQNCHYHQERDINEAIDAYKHGLYKSCALMLFSLIDALLIHTQDGTEYAENRKQGNSGIKRFEKLKNPDLDASSSFLALSFVLCVDALNVFFDSTTNFTNGNSVLNRHLLCHGMLNRPVSKTDCVQLFLLYENMLYCTGALYSDLLQ